MFSHQATSVEEDTEEEKNRHSDVSSLELKCAEIGRMIGGADQYVRMREAGRDNSKGGDRTRNRCLVWQSLVMTRRLPLWDWLFQQSIMCKTRFSINIKAAFIKAIKKTSSKEEVSQDRYTTMRGGMRRTQCYLLECRAPCSLVQTLSRLDFWRAPPPLILKINGRLFKNTNKSNQRWSSYGFDITERCSSNGLDLCRSSWFEYHHII